MSRLDEMITEMCPDGVPYRPVAAEFTKLRGTAITAGKMSEIQDSDGPITIFAGGKTRVSAFEDDIPHANIVRVPSVLIQSRGIIDTRFIDYPFTFKNEMWAYTSDVTTKVKFLHYYLQAHIDHFRRLASKMGSLPQISGNDTDRYLIPIPPLPVQEEIVRTLDAFTALETELEAELQAELDARKKQYEWYRHKALQFANCEQYLRDVAVIKRGDYVTQKSMSPGSIPVVMGGTEPAYYCDRSNHNGPAIVISRSGASAGFVSFWDKPIFISDGFALEAIKDVSPRFLYYVLKDSQNMLHSLKRGAGVPHVRPNEILNLSFPIPPLEEQEQVVSRLDRFDVLTNDLTSGLSAEIAARRKQYEYYRNKLLTFPRKQA